MSINRSERVGFDFPFLYGQVETVQNMGWEVWDIRGNLAVHVDALPRMDNLLAAIRHSVYDLETNEATLTIIYEPQTDQKPDPNGRMMVAESKGGHLARRGLKAAMFNTLLAETSSTELVAGDRAGQVLGRVAIDIQNALAWRQQAE